MSKNIYNNVHPQARHSFKESLLQEKKAFFDYNLVLQNSVVRLKFLEKKDTKRLLPFVWEERIWQYFAYKMTTILDMKSYVKEALTQRKLSTRYTFVIETVDTHEIMGSTSFGNYSEKDQRIEIGWSWLGKEFQGTQINKNTKFLLLNFAFDYLDLRRVEFKTDLLNQPARNALLKIGAKEEGILRSHTLMPDNRRRDTVYYGIIKEEWPDLQNNIFSDLSSLNLIISD